VCFVEFLLQPLQDSAQGSRKVLKRTFRSSTGSSLEGDSDIMLMEADLPSMARAHQRWNGASIDEISTVAGLAVSAPAGIYVTRANTKPTLRRILPPLVGAKDPGFSPLLRRSRAASIPAPYESELTRSVGDTSPNNRANGWTWISAG